MTDTLTPILQPYVDSTMISAFRSCPRKFFNEFVLGLRPSGISIDLHAGGCFAHALEVVRKEVFVHKRGVQDALLRAQAAFQIKWGDVTVPEGKRTAKTMDRTWAAVESYFANHPPITDHIQPYFINGKPTFEFTFAIPLEPAVDFRSLVSPTGEYQFPLHPVTNEPFLYVGRFDMLGEYRGVPIVEDDKTGGTGFYAGWSEKWDLRSQFIGYTWACQQLGIEVDTVAVRGIGILKELIHHAEAIKPYSDALRARWLEQLRRDMWKIVRAYNENYWDYNFAESCTAYGNCIFIQPCQSPTPDPWLKTFDVRRWNPTTQDDPTT